MTKELNLGVHIRSIAWHRTALALACWEDRAVRVWDARSRVIDPCLVLNGHKQGVLSVAWSGGEAPVLA